MLAAPAAAMSAGLSAKRYMPTALIGDQLPAGLGDVRTVPKLHEMDGETSEARLKEYIAAVRSTARVFRTYNHQKLTLESYDSQVVWVDAWMRMSGFGAFVSVDSAVRCTCLSERGRLAGHRIGPCESCALVPLVMICRGAGVCVCSCADSDG